MKVSYQGLKQYAPFSQQPDQLAALLTDLGLEVEEIETVEAIQGGLKGVVIGQVIEAVQHPNADRLRICQVTLDGHEKRQIVCGAPNVAAGQKVAVATEGTTIYLPDGTSFVIKKSKIRGEESNGMICAEDELGLGNDHAGIMVLPEDAPLGNSLASFLGIESDFVFHIGLTPNRTDAMGHEGIARELAFAVGIPFKVPGETLPISLGQSPVKLNVLDESICTVYSGLVIRGTKAVESPDWLKKALMALGLKPMNVLVDVTNYLLHHTGQPLHAFDLATWNSNQIQVRFSKAGEKIKLLTGEEKQLPQGVPVIADDQQPMAIAGIMGGANHSISANTTDIFIESACFNPTLIRKASRILGIKTDSSYRFERGTDRQAPINVLNRAASMIIQLAGGTLDGGIVAFHHDNLEPVNLTLRLQKLHQVLGYRIENEQVERILTGIGYKITNTSQEHIDLLVPTNRVDVKREIDVMEDVLRVYGLNNIPDTGKLSYASSYPVRSTRHEWTERLAGFLASRGFQEIMALSFSSDSTDLDNPSRIKPANPLNESLKSLRTSLQEGGLQAVSYNQRRQSPDLKFFEMGRTYQLTESGKLIEEPWLALWVTGKTDPENWQLSKKATDYYSLKAHLEQLSTAFGWGEWQISVENNASFAFSAQIISGKKQIGRIGKVAKSTLKRHDLKQEVYYAEIRLDSLWSLNWKSERNMQEPPRFPAVRRDLALVIDKQLTFDALVKTARQTEKQLLHQINLFDVYEGEKLEQGQQSYALSFILRHPERTLTDTEVEKVMQKLIANFERQHQAKIRQ